MNLNQRRAPAPKPQAVKKEKKGLKPKPGAKMQNFDKAAFLRSRGIYCECGCGERYRLDAHHALFPRNKKYPELDVEENLAAVDHFEHTQLKKFSGLAWREYFYMKNRERYGRERMIRWLASLPVKLHSRIDFLDSADKALFNAAVMNG